jgi:hypothetical protein
VISKLLSIIVPIVSDKFKRQIIVISKLLSIIVPIVSDKFKRQIIKLQIDLKKGSVNLSSKSYS